MALRPLIFSLLLLLLAGCGGGTETTSTVPASIRLETASIGTDGAGNDVVTVTATITDEAGRPVSGNVEVRVNWTQPFPPSIPQMFPTSTISVIAGTSDENGQLSVPVTIDSFLPTTIIAAAGTITSNTICVTRLGDTTAPALVAVIPSLTGRYAINCYGFDGVAGFDMSVSYDTAMASGPVIERGAFGPGALMVSNAETAGTLRIACMTPYPSSLSGDGTLATVYFNRETATSPGTVSAIQVKLVDVRGGSIPARTMLINSY
jgi:hypothetical protein